MEKKNMVLLTVIAVATLLVAVVGATFAFFTASVSTTNPGENTTTVKTKALASATMTNGATINSSEALPGFEAVKELTIKGSCGGTGNETCDPISATIKVTANIDSAFGSDVSWYLIKKDGEGITCSQTSQGKATDPEGVYMSPACTGVPEELDSTGSIIHGNESGSKTTDISVTAQTNDTYYLYVKYANNGDQNAQQGKTFTISVDFTATETP